MLQVRYSITKACASTVDVGEVILSGAETDYKSYMLRLWWVKEPHGYTWRASLENVESGELTGFATLEMLIEFLQCLAEDQEPGKEAGYELDH